VHLDVASLCPCKSLSFEFVNQTFLLYVGKLEAFKRRQFPCASRSKKNTQGDPCCPSIDRITVSGVSGSLGFCPVDSQPPADTLCSEIMIAVFRRDAEHSHGTTMPAVADQEAFGQNFTAKLPANGLRCRLKTHHVCAAISKTAGSRLSSMSHSAPQPYCSKIRLQTSPRVKWLDCPSVPEWNARTMMSGFDTK
jgi:hypothetical protein